MRSLRFLWVLGVLLLPFGDVVLAQGAAAGSFSDVAGTPYAASIEKLAKIGVIGGYEDGSFRPLAAVNRAEMLKIIFAALEEDASLYPGGCFKDVANEWFAPYVCRAKDLGIVQGYPDGFYRPGQTANMVETLKIAIHAFDLPVEKLKEGENWYIPYMDFAHRNNLFSKYRYFAGREAYRGEVAFLVDRVVDIQRQETYIGAQRNVKSAGCGKPAPGFVSTSFMVGGVERSAITVIPAGYNPDEPFSLVFAFHGRTNSNSRVRSYYGIEKPSNGQAIFVYPAGVQTASGYSWSNGGDKAGSLRDYEFFDVMLAEISENYCVNMDEIYAVGHSLGGWFTNSLACARGNVLRGVASLGGGRSNSVCTGPVAVMQWHNPKDELASFASGEAARDQFLAQNQCSSTAKPVAPASGNCVLYEGCSDFAPVVWCPHTQDYDSRGQYYTHNWPKDAGPEMWKFLEALL